MARLRCDGRGQTEEAERWFRQAAEAGDRGAQSNLGVLLAAGGQTEEAERWLRRAADGGDPTAAEALKHMRGRQSGTKR